MAQANEVLRSTANPADVFLPYYDELLRFLTNRLGCTQSAADALQDVYVRVLNRGEGIVQPRAFLYQVARTVLIDLWRHDECRRQHLEATTRALRDDPASSPSIDDPHLQLEHREDLALVRTAIAALPERCRTVFILHRFGGRSYAEIGEQLAISVSTVEKHMIKALMQLRQHLMIQPPIG